VFDCWFESGAMPYAKVGFPWKTQTLNTPADFVAEGLDQTRGWFYTLSVLSTLLFDQPAFKNVSVNGLVLAEDGKKMSKKLKNYPDPSEVLEAYGADALRLYFMSKPVVCGTEMKFSKTEVEEQVKKNVLRLYNAYHLFVTYANLHNLKPTGTVQQPTKFLNKYLVELTTTLPLIFLKLLNLITLRK
jgi:isoleucyl-tRNA synthetase